MKNVVQDLTSTGIDWQREKWQSGLGSKFIHQGEKNAAKYADEVIVLSKGVQDYFKETYGRETHFIPNGVNRPQIREAKLIKDHFGLEKDSYILFLGRLVPEKGIRYLVEAFKKVKTDKKLVIAGGSSDTDLLMLFEVLASYLFTYKRSILYAKQKNYIVFIADSFYLLLAYAVQILIIIFTKNYYWYLACKVVLRIVENSLLNLATNKWYPYLKVKNAEKLDKAIFDDIVLKVKGTMFHKIGAYVVYGTDNVLLSKFFGLLMRDVSLMSRLQLRKSLGELHLHGLSAPLSRIKAPPRITARRTGRTGTLSG